MTTSYFDVSAPISQDLMLQSLSSLVSTRSDALRHLNWPTNWYSQRTTVVLLIQNQLHISSVKEIYNFSIFVPINRYLMIQSLLSLVSTRSDVLRHLNWPQSWYSKRTTAVLLIKNQLHISSLKGISNCPISVPINRYLMIQSLVSLVSTRLDALQHLNWSQSRYSKRTTVVLLIQNQLHISSLQGISN